MLFPENFEISDITRYENTGMVKAVVTFTFPDELGGTNVAQGVRITVRILTTNDVTIAQLHEALFQKAVEVLHRATSKSENTSAHQLILDGIEAQNQ